MRSYSPRERLSLVISAYNEEEALPKLIEEIIDTLKDRDALQVIIINDGSTDRTAEVMHSLSERYAYFDETFTLITHHLPNNQGMGAALKAGYRLASEPWVTFLPGDGQISPAMIEPLCEAVDRGAIAVSTYYTNREYRAYRAVLSRGLRLLNAIIVGVQVTSEGIYLIEKSALHAMPLTSDSFMLNLEIPIRAARAQLPMETVGIEVRSRQGGTSSATQWSRIFNTFRDLIGLRIHFIREAQEQALLAHPPKNTQRIWTVVKVVLLALLLFWAHQRGLLSKSWTAIQSLHFIDALCALIALGVTLILGVIRWRWILRSLALKEPTFLQGLRLYYEGLFYNTFAPGAVGGDLLRAHWLRIKDPNASQLHYLITLSERIFGLASLTVLAAWAWGGMIWSATIFSLGLLFLAALPFIHTSLKSIKSSWLMAAVSLNILSHLISFTLYLSLGRSLQIDIPLHAWFETLTLAVLAANLPLSIAGIGPREAALVTLLGAYGIAKSDALALSITALACLALHAIFGGLLHLFSSTRSS